MSCKVQQSVCSGCVTYAKSRIDFNNFNNFNTFNNVATETQTKLVGFCLGDKANYSATNYANHIWFDPTNKQILLNGIEYIPKKLSELVNDKNFLTSITKSMVENVLTGNITSHTHSYLPLSGGALSGDLTLRNIYITSTASELPSHYFHKLYSDTDFSVYEHFGTNSDRNKVTYGQFRFFDGNGSYKTLKIGGDGTFKWNGTDVSLNGHTHSQYLPLTGGTLTGALTCNGDYINMNNDSGSRGYRGFFNQSNNTNRASGSHIFMKGGGYALGTNSVSIGYQAYAGIRNEDADKTTYPYIAWQWMPTAKFMVDTTNSATLSGGEYYGFPLLPNEMVQWNIGGQKVIYENSSSYKELLVVIKASDADTGLVFGGKTTLPYSASKTLIAGKYIVGSGEYLKKIDEYTINGVKYYQVIIYTWSTTAFPTSYDFTQQVKVMCATKVSNSDYSGALSYASGSSSVASGFSSVASGNYSVASGYSSVASGFYSVASGSYSVASGNSSVASGSSSVASGFSSVASGSSSVASGNSSVASGNYSVASGYSSVASGYSSVASGTYSVASGYTSVASGAYSVASGYSSVASGYYSVASGYYSVASGDFSVVLALNGETMSSYQTIVGKFNAKVAGLFIIGNGTSNTARSNAFVVDDSGNVTAKYFSGYANAIGGEGFKIYAENNNQINFGGTGSDNTVVFGAASKDSRSVPTTYKFGANGDATIQAASFSGNAATATNADTLDGYHAEIMVKSNIDNADDLTKLTTRAYFKTAYISGQGDFCSLVVPTWGGNTTEKYYITELRFKNGSINPQIRTYSKDDGTSSWGSLALLTDNVATATKLKTPITLWGKSFDGSGNIDGSITLSTAQNAVQQSRGIKNTSSSGFIGYTDKEAAVGPDGEVIGESYNGISLGWGKNPETDAASVRINNSIFTYKSYPILHSNNFSDYAPTKTGGGASGTWGISISGNAATATKLGASSVGSATQPIYLNGGTPTACTYTLGKSVPSNAVFTDTTYSVATVSADGLMSAAMFKAQMLKSVGIKQGDEMVKPDGTITITDHSMYITQDKSNINGVYVTSSVDGGGVKIPNATKNYDGSMSYTDKRKLDGISPYAPKKVVALRLSFNADATVTVISGGGDYDMTQDAELMGSKYVEQTSTNILYLTTFTLDLAAASTDTLNNLFSNSFVKFSFMGKSTSGISDFTITVKSNFYTDTLDIQFVSTKQDDSWVVDCVWEFF